MNLLVTGAFACTEKELNELAWQGHEVVFMQQEKDPLPCKYEWVEGIIGNGIFLHHPIEKFTSLKFIQLTSAGFDRVPMEYVNQKGIKIFNARGVYSIPMAEYALAGVLSLYKKLEFFSQKQKQHIWEKHRGVMELFGKTVLIVGAGNVGSECAKRFSAFGCQVFGADICPTENPNFTKVLPMSELDKILNKADVVILTLPLTDETRGLFDKSKFAIMKDGALFVNIARGAVVNTKDLIEALNERLSGAVLDVFETEPLEKDSPLWDTENVIITPHNSFVGEGNKQRLFDVVIENLVKWEEKN
ncbi:MAG: hydroxyacid dehydrogenase [Clostridia bacterium]|nr:hydroxyacid dehydrogenase [Clostridia bacterium]